MSSPTHPLGSLLKAPQVLLTIRTWACWEKAQWLTIGLPIFFLVNWALVYGFLHHFLRSVKCKSNFTALLTLVNACGCHHNSRSTPTLCKSVWVFSCRSQSYFRCLLGRDYGLPCRWRNMSFIQNHNLKPIFRPLIAYGYSRFPHT